MVNKKSPLRENRRGLLNLGVILFYKCLDAFFWNEADGLFYCLSVLEYHKCRDAHDVEAGSESWLFVNVDFADLYAGVRGVLLPIVYMTFWINQGLIKR